MLRTVWEEKVRGKCLGHWRAAVQGGDEGESGLEELGGPELCPVSSRLQRHQTLAPTHPLANTNQYSLSFVTRFKTISSI